MNYQTFEAPNLDDITAEEANEWARVFHLLERYAATIRAAKGLRAAGNISEALNFEAKCADLYDELPAEVRW